MTRPSKNAEGPSAREIDDEREVAVQRVAVTFALSGILEVYASLGRVVPKDLDTQLSAFATVMDAVVEHMAPLVGLDPDRLSEVPRHMWATGTQEEQQSSVSGRS